ncbi:MAG: hypothetical protein IPO08_05155 [Xanthomonadales bacterium]|nr:hypothetical protein [Xanthomonadales bacterium]
MLKVLMEIPTSRELDVEDIESVRIVRRVPELEDLLAYRNEDAIYSFLRKFALSTQEADVIFADMLRFLWMNQRLRASENSETVPIDGPLRIIDEMWHAFILHTRSYAEFCEKYFGRFLHHQPALRGEHESHRQVVASIPVEERLEWLRTAKRSRYERVLECLGEPVFRRWYLDYPRRYSSDALARLVRFA